MSDDPYRAPAPDDASASESSRRWRWQLSSHGVVSVTILGCAAIGVAVGTTGGALLGNAIAASDLVSGPSIADYSLRAGIDWILGGFVVGLLLGTALGVVASFRAKPVVTAEDLIGAARDRRA